MQGVDGTTFTLEPTGGSPILATVSYNPATFTATLTPSSALSPSTDYTVRLDGGPAKIRDLADNPLVDTNWTFVTAAPSSGAIGTSGAVSSASIATGPTVTLPS